MAAEAENSVGAEISFEQSKPLDTWEQEEVRCFMERHFSNEIASKFEAEDIDGESLIRLLRKPDEDKLFTQLGLTTFGKLCKFRNLVESLLPCHTKNASPSTTLSTSSQRNSPKLSINEISSYGKDMQLLYKTKRRQIQKAAITVWPGNEFPNFRIAENKNKLDQLAQSLKEECSIPEVNFGIEGIRQHIQSVFNERRRARKRDKINYDLPDKRSLTRVTRDEHDKVTPPLSTMQVTDDNKDKNNDCTDAANDSRGDPVFVPLDNDNGAGDTDIISSDNSSESDHEPSQSLLKTAKMRKKNVTTSNKKTKKISLHSNYDHDEQVVSASGNLSESDLESSQPVLKKAKKNVTEKKKKEVSVHSSRLSKHHHDQEVTAINLSSKSAKVLILSYSGMENITNQYLYQLMKELGGKVSLARSLNSDALHKAVAVKLVNQGFVKVKAEASLSNLKRSDIITCVKK